MSSTCSTTVVRPSSARSAAIRDTAGPHIMPWPHAQAIVDAVDRGAVAQHERADQRQMVGRVLDRRRPRLLHAEVLRGGSEGVEPALHLPQVGPVDRSSRAGLLVGIRHAPQEPALLGPPVDARADVEGHRRGVGVQRRRGLRDDRPDAGRSRPTRARPRPPATACIAGPPVRITVPVAIVPADVSTPVTTRWPARPARVRRPRNVTPSRSSTPAPLHREAVRAHVSRRVDPAVGRDVASRRGSRRRPSRDQAADLGASTHATSRPDLALHRDPVVRGALLARRWSPGSRTRVR